MARAPKPATKRAKVKVSGRQKDSPASSKSCMKSHRKAKLFRKKMLMNNVRHTDAIMAMAGACLNGGLEWATMKRDTYLADARG